MIKKVLSVLLAGVLLLGTAAALSSCGQEAEFPVTIGKITIEQEPENIVILDKNLADIISAIGYDVKMVGRSDEVNQKGLKVVPSVGTSHDPSVTKIIKAKTDIVFANSSLNDTDVAKLEKAGIIVANLESAHTLKQLKSLYDKIGRMLGGNVSGKTAAMKAYKEVKDTLKAVKNAAKRDKTVTTLAYLYADNGVLKTVTSGTWEATMLDYTGSMNVFGKADSDVVDIDQLLLANPNYIFVSDKGVQEYLTTSDVLSDLNALSDHTSIIPLDELKLQGYTALDVTENMLKAITSDSEDDSSDEETDESAEEYAE